MTERVKVSGDSSWNRVRVRVTFIAMTRTREEIKSLKRLSGIWGAIYIIVMADISSTNEMRVRVRVR
jgi:hypothetical protein